MKSNSSPEAQIFEKVLRAFETRGINYSDVLSRLRRLLAKGASPTELLAVLRRRESRERLPEYAAVEALLLDVSVAPQITAEAVDDSELEDSAGSLPAPDQAEAGLRTLRVALAERDVTLEHLRQTIALRDAQIETLTREQRSAQTVLAEQVKVAAEQNSALAADLDAARIALEAEQHAAREVEFELAERTKETAALAAELRAARVQLVSVASRAPAAEAAAPALDVGIGRSAPHLPEVRPPRQPSALFQGAGTRTVGLIAVAVLIAGLAALYLQRPSHVPAPAKTAAALPDPGTIIRDCPVCPEMKVLPAGRFKQGSAGAYASAHPLHWVAIRRRLALSTNPVTLDDFRQFVAATGRDMHGCDIYDGDWKTRADAGWDRPGFSQSGDEPVTCVSWNDAEAYAKWLSARTGYRYRLPSASEWEYAARAGADAPSPWAPDDRGACASANVADASARRHYPGWTVFPCDDGYVYTAPVGTFKPSPFGLNDMLGNVLEWTADCWHANYMGAPIDGSAWLDGDCSQHEVRGASWFSTPSHGRVDYRDRFSSDYRTSTLGIRLVREIDP